MEKKYLAPLIMVMGVFGLMADDCDGPPQPVPPTIEEATDMKAARAKFVDALSLKLYCAKPNDFFCSVVTDSGYPANIKCDKDTCWFLFQGQE